MATAFPSSKFCLQGTQAIVNTINEVSKPWVISHTLILITRRHPAQISAGVYWHHFGRQRCTQKVACKSLCIDIPDGDTLATHHLYYHDAMVELVGMTTVHTGLFHTDTAAVGRSCSCLLISQEPTCPSSLINFEYQT